MSEEEKPKEEQTPADTGEGVQPETVSELDRADQIAERLKRENDRKEELLTREENLEARRRVGGVAEAGQQSKPKEETPKEYRARIEKEMREGKTDFN